MKAGRHLSLSRVVAVALHVGLVHDVEAVVVEQRVHLGVVRIVTRADRIEVVAFEEQDILDHRLDGNRLAQLRVDVVAVGALEEDPTAVDPDAAVADLDLAEPVLREGRLERLSVTVLQFEEHRIEIGRLGRPELRRGDGKHGLGNGLGATGHTAEREALLCDAVPFGIEQRDIDRGGLAAPAPDVGHMGADAQAGAAEVVGQVGIEAEVAQTHLRGGVKVDVAVDAAQAEHVLILEVAAVRPAVDLDGQRIAARTDIARDVELGIVVRALAVAYPAAIDPDVHGAVDAVEVEVDLTVLPVGRQVEIAAVGTHRVGLRLVRIALLRKDEGRLILVRVGHVRVDRRTVAVHLPVRRNGNLVPRRDVVTFPVEIRGTLVGALHPMELPHAVEQHVTARAVAHPRPAVARVTLHLGHRGEGHEGRMARLLVHGEDRLVLPVVVAGRAQGREVDPGRRTANCPPLSGVIGRRGHLPGRLARLHVGTADIESARTAGDRIGILPDRGQFPLLVGIAGARAPLDQRPGLRGAVGVVDALVGKYGGNLPVAPGRGLGDDPELRRQVSAPVVQEDLGFVVEAALVVEHQPTRADDLVESLRIEVLRRRGTGRAQSDGNQPAEGQEAFECHTRFSFLG